MYSENEMFLLVHMDKCMMLAHYLHAKSELKCVICNTFWQKYM